MCQAPRVQRLAVLVAWALVFTVGRTEALAEAPLAPPPPIGARPAEICVLRAGGLVGEPGRGSPNPSGQASSQAGGQASYVIRDNGNLVGTVGEDYFCYGAPPGPHRVTVEAGSQSATIEVAVAPSQRVFVRQSFEGDRLALARLSEAGPQSAPVAGPPPPPPPPPPSPFLPPGVRPRPESLVYGIDLGVGLGSSHLAPTTQATAAFAALGSIVIGTWATDFFFIAGRLDATLLNGGGVGDLAVHLGLFPGAGRYGWRRDFTLFVDGGIATPFALSSTVTTTAPSVAGMARIGVGLQRWQVGPTVLGPLLCGQIIHSSGEADAALLAGITAIISSPPRTK
jgi:hypothetical protein